MIDKRVFLAWWARLEERFGQTPGVDAYLRYLNGQGMETEEFDAAASAVWATCRFFPRPAEFLLIQAGASWRAILEVVPQMPYKPIEEWQGLRAKIPDRGWDALQGLGGARAVTECTDIVRLRRDFLDAYESQVIEQSRGALSLDSGPKSMALIP